MSAETGINFGNSHTEMTEKHLEEALYQLFCSCGECLNVDIAAEVIACENYRKVRYSDGEVLEAVNAMRHRFVDMMVENEYLPSDCDLSLDCRIARWEAQRPDDLRRYERLKAMLTDEPTDTERRQRQHMLYLRQWLSCTLHCLKTGRQLEDWELELIENLIQETK